jgi:16S rRNA (cytidine1402-2'-O)-methyltransferase
VALVSDAGTPLVNDPGAELVRAAIEAGHPVSPIPGPSAPLAALTASGLPAEAFLYLGYLPRRSKERQAALRQVSALPYTLIFLEAPHRLLDSLRDLLAVLGDRQIAAARELTKLHEQFWRGPLSAALADFSETPPRGEFTLVVAGAPPEPALPPAEAGLRRQLAALLADGVSAAQAAAQVAATSGVNRRRLYPMVIEIQQKAGSHEP